MPLGTKLLERVMPAFQLASTDVTYQLLDGEVVAIHFTKGTYHSFRGAAAIAFDALATGTDSQDLMRLFVDAPAGASDELAAIVEKSIEAGLLAPSASAPAPEIGTRERSVTVWTSPLFETYTDMQQLLLADPIHDVGDAAWPRVAAAPEQPPK